MAVAPSLLPVAAGLGDRRVTLCAAHSFRHGRTLCPSARVSTERTVTANPGPAAADGTSFRGHPAPERPVLGLRMHEHGHADLGEGEDRLRFPGPDAAVGDATGGGVD